LQDRITQHGPERAQRAQRAAAAGDSDDEVARWGAGISWAEILEPTDWINTGKSDYCGCDIWTAPGLHATEKSATAHEPGCREWADSEDPPTYKIGVSLPLSGDLAQYGIAVRNGINLARDRFPAKFKDIEFSYEDNRYDAKTSLSVLRKFQTKNVDLLYSWGEVPFNAIAKTADKEFLPLAAYSLDNTLAKGSRCIVLTSNDPHTLTAPLVRALRKRGAKRFAVVKIEDPYINAVIDGFRSNLRESE
jgi:ABC-type branched-subunit amino acid transport system substrate-binding protein